MAVSPRGWGVAVAVLGLLLDQASKLYLLGPFALGEKGRVAVTPFLDLVLVWNRGVSYGLLQQDGEAGRWVLVAVGLAGSALFAWWLWRADRLLQAVALGLIIGGALSNVIDRIAYGAVADFFLLHAGGFEWYVFNLADAWIVAGVVGLLLAWAVERPEKATES
ncbi:MAG TPA: signal peptidase II [Afifellaceae bacterium]|nr:signal peptidase II [Afifellaceae bacterium]